MSAIRDTVRLPTRIYSAKPGRIVSVNGPFPLELELGYGIRITRRFLIEGVSQRVVPHVLEKQAHHCLVLMLCGKRLLLQTADFGDDDGPLPIGRLFLDETVYGQPVGVVRPYEMNIERLEIGSFFGELAETGFDVGRVRAVVNGSNGLKGSPRVLRLEANVPA